MASISKPNEYKQAYLTAKASGESPAILGVYLGQWMVAAGNICKHKTPLNPRLDKNIAATVLSQAEEGVEHYKAIQEELEALNVAGGFHGVGTHLANLEALAGEAHQIINTPREPPDFSYD